MAHRSDPPLPWLEPGDPFPPVTAALGRASGAAGLLAAGGALDVETLARAYRAGIFPWFSRGQPILWWSPDPRMVLAVDAFRLHPSLRKTLRRFLRTPGCALRIDSAFGEVIDACAQPRPGHGDGTWIVPPMRVAYRALHAAGLAHSVETWIDGQLVGGLYCVSLGRAVFGESMFSRRNDASKIALAGLVALCKAGGASHIDCQQHTGHLASLGAADMPRAAFLRIVAQAAQQPALSWKFDPVYWNHILPPRNAPP